MIFDAARAALANLFTPAFRSVFLKTLGITLLGLAAAWVVLKRLFDALLLPRVDLWLQGLSGGLGWVDVLLGLAAGLGLALAAALLIGPVTALVAGLFLDDIAETVERNDYPRDTPGRALPLGRSIVLSLKFFGIVILGNLFALLLLLIPVVNVAAFFVVNGYLLGREFFEFAALRFRPEAEARALRRQNAGTVFMAGLVVAAFMAIPLVNLLTPLFAAAMMVHLHKAVTRTAR
ncbi:MAG: sulfate transporter family protein [Rhizobiaceae bacterium]|nr:sulfate transporter family protein [Rhizobiaceae bacterium]